MRHTLFVLAMLLSVVPSFAQITTASRKPGPLAHTFSIVARDPQTGEIGVAVQSHWFAVGGEVPWAEAGVGAVATQSFVDPSYGPLGLQQMRMGKSAPDALKGLIAGDDGRDVRQVAMIDAKGHIQAWTGAKCVQSAGQIVDEQNQFSVQANMMANPNIWPAMAKAYRETKGDLADRLLAALDAAQAAGGDLRGRQSAAIIVVKAQSSGKPWQDRIFDLRVDDNAYPLKELRRLVGLQRAYNHMNAGDLASEKNDAEGMLREYSAAEKIASSIPDVPQSRLNEMMYWHAVGLVSVNRLDDALPLFKKVFASDSNWVEMTRRLPKSGLLPDDPKLIEKIVSQAK
ncbi:MAG TPA: DUF1028 domain-containing protein [Terriglobales bacterium]